MRWVWGVMALVLASLLTGCVAVPVQQDGDPYTRQGQAEGEIRATQQAQIDQVAQTTREAAVRQAKASEEIDVLMAPLRASQTAILLESTRGAATDIAAQATATANSQQTTATVIAGQATATQAFANFQMEQLQQEADLKKETAKFWNWFWPGVTLIVLGGTIVFLLILEWRMIPWIIEFLDRKNSIHENRFGTITVWVDPNAAYQPKILSQAPQPVFTPGNSSRSIIKASSTENVQSLDMNGNVLSSPIRQPDRSEQAMLLQFVQAAERAVGGHSSVFPRWNHMPGCTSGVWQHYIGLLVRSQAAIAEPNVGTYVAGRYQCIADLVVAVQKGEIPLPRAAEGS